MKPSTKTIVAIATTINGHTEYISGQSVREFDGKYLPQYNQDPVHAKDFREFKSSMHVAVDTHSDNTDVYHDETDAKLHANLYLENVANHFNRIYNVVTVEIPVIRDLKKYDRDKKKESKVRATPVIKKNAVVDALIIFIACIVLVSCSASRKYGCPSTDQNKLNKHAERPFRS